MYRITHINPYMPEGKQERQQVYHGLALQDVRKSAERLRALGAEQVVVWRWDSQHQRWELDT